MMKKAIAMTMATTNPRRNIVRSPESKKQKLPIVSPFSSSLYQIARFLTKNTGSRARSKKRMVFFSSGVGIGRGNVKVKRVE
ncbi:hypothetical protein CsSME_00007187 [Camellia sinensis var. sinensis]